MHSYLRAVGFSNIKNRVDMDKIIGMVMDKPTGTYSKKIDKLGVVTEIYKDFGERMGITLRGEYDEKGFFHLEHYFPHFFGQTISTKEEVVINKRVDTDAYTGMCDDVRLGVSLIFYLQNVIDYFNSKTAKDNYYNVMPITLAGLSISGKIILPVDNDESQIRNKSAEAKQRNNLIAEARKGNQDAIDSLTIDDIDLYANISKRIKNEDLYSVVESTFIPYGSESDNYSIIGNIIDSSLVENSYSREKIYDLLISCNDIVYNVCINQMDLIGEPMPGRRFKGSIWMQGMINFVE